MKFLIPTLILTMLFAAASGASAKSKPVPAEKGFLMKTIQLDGRPVKYVVYVPPTYDPAKPTPAIVFLNGAGECGTDGLKHVSVGLGSAVMNNVDKWPFIIVLPQKQDIRHAWEDEDAMVMAMLEATRKGYNVDKTRIYLTGLSQGGHGTWTLGAKHPDIWAAIAPVCGWSDEAVAKKLVDAKTPIWDFHGDADPAVKVEASYEMEKFIKAAGGSMKMTIYPGVGHNCWDKAYRDENLADWFLEHRKVQMK